MGFPGPVTSPHGMPVLARTSRTSPLVMRPSAKLSAALPLNRSGTTTKPPSRPAAAERTRNCVSVSCLGFVNAAELGHCCLHGAVQTRQDHPSPRQPRSGAAASGVHQGGTIDRFRPCVMLIGTLSSENESSPFFSCFEAKSTNSSFINEDKTFRVQIGLARNEKGESQMEPPMESQCDSKQR